MGKPAKNPTISDVAALAGVSKSTVSAVLNHKKIRESTRRAVVRVIEELNYRPSPSARRGFRPASGKSVTFIVKEAANPYYAEILLGVQEVTSDQGYLTAVSSSEGSYEVERRIVEQSMERDVDGLIITPILSDDVDLAHLFELKRHGAPFVLLEEVRGIRANLVDVDNVKASCQAAKFLIDGGHSLIVHFAGPPYSEHSQERTDGVRRAFSESHLRFDEAMIVPTGASAEDGHRVGLEYFGSRRAHRPTAVTCYNDLVALGLLRALRELGIGVPEEVSVIGFDGLDLLDYFPLPLTTVRVPKYEMGKRAAEILIRQIESRTPATAEPEKVSLDAELVVRASTRQLTA
ncbi:MAG TPA: LacI family DNA-binding transcriptional regulator [Gemmatimonadales bacterium]|nr:LacI family DNA-binding transcriptional regulator [Gemmatimonadales bacterium]